MILLIDTSAAKEHAYRLMMMGKSAFPIVVRQVLNRTAYDVKTLTMPEESHVFVHRKPTFFKSNSKVLQAQGFDINSMASTIGFIPKPDAKDSSVDDLEQQEQGGAIKGRAFIPLAQDRVGGKWQGNVRNAGRYRVFAGKIFDSKDAPGNIKRYGKSSGATTEKEKFILSAIEAAKVGGIVIGNRLTSKGNKIAWRIDHVNRFFGNTYVVAKQLFAVKAGREVDPKATHFMQKASLTSAAKMNLVFIELAEKKINAIK